MPSTRWPPPRPSRTSGAADGLAPVQLASEAVLLTAETVELHLAVQGCRVHQGVLRGEVDAPAVLAQHPSEVVLLGPAQVLLQRHLVVVARLASVPVAALPPDARVPGEVHLPNDRAAGAEDGTLDHVPELADVARPSVAHQLRQRLVRAPVDPLLPRHLAVAQELAHEQRNVLDALPQRRYAHGDDVDPVVEVLAHAALGHGCGQIHVGGADDPHVDLDPAVRAELLDLSLLQDPQQLELHVQRDALDLVEEQRAAARQLDLADPVVHRPRECAALVAEELALEQRVRKRRAVDRDEAAALALTLEMDRAGRQLLARPRFARSEEHT